MKKIILMLAVLVSLNACSYTFDNTLIHPADHTKLIKYNEAKNINVVIGEFEDIRGRKNKDLSGVTMIVPLVPFSSAIYERPDLMETFASTGYGEYTTIVPTGKFFNMDLNNLEDVTTYYLGKSNLFDSVNHLTKESRSQKSNYDYFLKATLKDFTYKSTVYGYGLSVLFFVPPLFGAPSSKIKQSIAIDFELYDANKNLVWSKGYSKESKVISGFYYEMGAEDANFPDLYQAIMQDVAKDLDKVFE
jgi:hypothetical protein